MRNLYQSLIYFILEKISDKSGSVLKKKKNVQNISPR